MLNLKLKSFKNFGQNFYSNLISFKYFRFSSATYVIPKIYPEANLNKNKDYYLFENMEWNNLG
jgi:hypothetical protein